MPILPFTHIGLSAAAKERHFIISQSRSAGLPLGYCSVATTGISSSLKAFSILPETSTISGKYWILFLNFSCKSQRNKHVFLGTNFPNLKGARVITPAMINLNLDLDATCDVWSTILMSRGKACEDLLDLDVTGGLRENVSLAFLHSFYFISTGPIIQLLCIHPIQSHTSFSHIKHFTYTSHFFPKLFYWFFYLIFTCHTFTIHFQIFHILTVRHPFPSHEPVSLTPFFHYLLLQSLDSITFTLHFCISYLSLLYIRYLYTLIFTHSLFTVIFLLLPPTLSI